MVCQWSNLIFCLWQNKEMTGMLLRKDIQFMQLPVLKGGASFDLFWTDLLPIALFFWDLESSRSVFTFSSLSEEMAAVPIERKPAGNKQPKWQCQACSIHFYFATCRKWYSLRNFTKFSSLGLWPVLIATVMPISTFSPAAAIILQLLSQVCLINMIINKSNLLVFPYIWAL